VTWKQRYRLKSYLRSSLWIVPVAAGLAERVFRIIVEALEGWVSWLGYGLGLEGAKALAARHLRAIHQGTDIHRMTGLLADT